ncbi:putative galactinol--sucrose galactosyltransferase 1 [Lasiodiplodia theobromae]|uniref:Putative galactinol--sucrose galactosyltransferase 1 n=1 Tax=Lasiodiplodia theobromae TaxID=45133 RepID=A0A5N5D8W7_9PEZI|nr:putative galactinol--sucrose galactosyltransferase 1 [Lasiodiplodia theobromae]
MYANLVCSPPLGQTTVVPADQTSVCFNALIETDPSSQKTWEVALWHNHAGHDEWEKLILTEEDPAPSLLVVNRDDSTPCRRRWFTGELPGRPNRPVSFTITFRAGQDEPWKWANEQFSYSDGHLHYQPAELSKAPLSDYLSNISPDLRIDHEASQTSDTLLWTATGKVNSAFGSESGRSNFTLGLPTHQSKWFALVRLWSPWLAPRQGREVFNPDKEAVLASFLRKDGSHLVVLAVSGINDVLTELIHDGNGNIVIHARNDGTDEQESTVIIAVGKSFELANAAAMYHARRLVMKWDAAADEIEAEIKAMEKNEMHAQWLEEWYDGLTYCTWNGLGQHLTEQAIFDALESLQKNDINITTLIIDDNWQSLDHEGQDQFKRGWLEFEANKEGFPNGLAHTTAEIRQRFKNVSHIAVWHAILGYWGGISPDGKIAQEYKTAEVLKKDGVSGGKFLVVDEEDVSRLYQDFYSFLSSSGIDSVKTDAQFFLDELDEADVRKRLIKTYQDAWSISILRYFSSKAISCMSQTPQILFHSQLPSNKPRLMVRNSDDFFPEVPASHPWHIFCNAHNSLLTQHLNVLPDWDMFQTSHPWASFHAAARCVSGGPIYITDVPGQHDISLINQMTAKTPRGSTVILRPHNLGKTIDAYTAYDDPALLKVATYVGRAQTGAAIVGVFNTTQRRLAELLCLDRHFPGTEQGEYVVRAHTTGQTSKVPVSRSDGNTVHLDLPVQAWEILSATPVHTLSTKHHEDVQVSVLGLVGKMTAAAAIVNYDAYVEREGAHRLRVWTSLKALGTFGLWVRDLAKYDVDQDFIALVFGEPVARHCVQVKGDVLEIDVARAWEEGGQKAGWSNEVAVEVFVR